MLSQMRYRITTSPRIWQSSTPCDLASAVSESASKKCHNPVIAEPASSSAPPCRRPAGKGRTTQWETPVLPPGQRKVRGWPVSHYGPVPRFRPERWSLRVFGATASGEEHLWSFEEFNSLHRATVTADLHRASGTTSTGHEWLGVPAGTVLDLAPPAPSATHVMAWAEYGYSANLRIGDFTSEGTVLATHRNGEQLTAEHGFPVRLVVPHLYSWKGPKWLRSIEYMTADRRGFWEERGYHNIADAWKEQRHSHQEPEADVPSL